MSFCDMRSVGVIISDSPTTRDGERFLVFDRPNFPDGVACPAGHVDDHGAGMLLAEQFRQAAVDEVFEEVGVRLHPLDLKYMTGGFAPGRCKRAFAGGTVPDAPGHDWRVYVAYVTPDVTLNPSRRETRNTRWLTREDLTSLAWRTAARARNHISAEAFKKEPGLEPVWVRWLIEANVIAPLPALDMERIQAMALQPPPVAA